mgnify:CR=1 FL=1
MKKVLRLVLLVVLFLASCAGMESCDNWLKEINKPSNFQADEKANLSPFLFGNGLLK